MNATAQPEVYLDPHAVAKAIGGKVVTGTNRIVAHAPGHKRGSPEISITVDPSAPRGLLVNCFSGEDAVTIKDWVLRQCGEPEFAPGQKSESPAAHLNLVKPKAEPKPFYDGHLTRQGYRATAEYDYATPDGEVLFQVVRYEGAGLDKAFLQRQPDGRGGWFSGRPEPIIYRWPEIAARPSEPIYVVEGEKDVDTLAAAGLLATTAPNGSWPVDLSPLRGRTCFVIPDNDTAGEEKAQKIVCLLQGIATVRRVDLPGLPLKGDVTDWLAAGNTVEQLQTLAKAAAPIAANQNERQRFTIDWFGDLDEDMPKETIVKGVFGVNEFTMLSGKPGSGKSVITTDLACHVAAGMEWHGRKVRQGLVVYVAAERRDLTKRRMRAFRKHHGIGNIPLAVVGGRLDMTSTVADAEALAASIRQLEEDCGHKCVWVIIDTLTRVFGAGDQNASKDMTKFVQSCDTLREAVPGSHVTVIHHTGWAGDRGKGAIDLDGAVDSSFLVKKEGRGYLLECDGTNDGEEGVITRFTMEGVQVGVDEDGVPTVAPIVIPGAVESPAERLLSGPSRKALDALIELSEDGEPVPMALWRAKCRELFDDGKGKSQDALNKQFDRAKEALVKEGKAESVDGGFLPT